MNASKLAVASCLLFPLVACFGQIAPLDHESVVHNGTLPEAGADAAAPLPDAATEPPPVPPTTACQKALAQASFSFDADDQGWKHGRMEDSSEVESYGRSVDPWMRGTATNGTRCHAGQCFATELSSNYRECQAAYLVSPPIDLSACAGSAIELVFQHAYSFASGEAGGRTWADGGFLEVSANGETWITPPAGGSYTGTPAPNETEAFASCDLPLDRLGKLGFIGESATTTEVRIALPASIVSATTRVRFAMGSGRSKAVDAYDTSTAFRRTNSWGWRIDDVHMEAR